MRRDERHHELVARPPSAAVRYANLRSGRPRHQLARQRRQRLGGLVPATLEPLLIPTRFLSNGWGPLQLFYNLAAAILLTHAGIGLSLAGILLWPAVILHVILAAWCMVCCLGSARC
jgi:hypothetical protein